MADETLIGKTFGRLTVVGLTTERTGRYKVWECRCECGNRITATTKQLSGGKLRSCGCLGKDPRLQHPAKYDCTCFRPNGPRCAGLTELLCMTTGKCSFYKSKRK